MIKDEQVKEIVKKVCKPGKPSKKEYNQLLMLEALIKIRDLFIKGFPEEDVLTECLMIEQTCIKIIETTLEGLTPIYD